MNSQPQAPPGLGPVAAPSPAFVSRDAGPAPQPAQRAQTPQAPDVVEKPALLIPGSMHSFERSWTKQLAFVILLFSLAVVNCALNFRVLDLFEELVERVRNLPEPDELDPALLDDVLADFEVLSESQSDLCDIPFFTNGTDGYDKEQVLSALESLLRILKASTYLAVGFGVPVTFFIKILSTYALVTRDFGIAPVDQLEKQRRESALKGELPPKPKKFDLIRTQAVEESIVLESNGERLVRVYLRSETIMFGFNQVCQDIPHLTGVIFYILIISLERGIFCYESFTLGNVEEQIAISDNDQIDILIYAQGFIIFLLAFVNIINLIIRWIKYFNHQTIKNFRKPTSTSVRVFQVITSILIYALGVMLPLFAVLYSDISGDLFGLKVDGSLGMMVVLIASVASMVLGMFLVCCFWGSKIGERICVCAVLLEACALGIEPCCEIEGVSLMRDVCC